MKRLVEWMVRAIPLLTCAALLCGMLRVASAAQWQALGEGVAMALMGWQTPPVASEDDDVSVRTEQVKGLPAVPEQAVQVSVPTLPLSIIPPKGDGGGAVVEEQIGGGISVTPTVSVKNNSGVDRDFTALLDAGMPFALASSDEPQVLIVHTHTTECYMSYYAGYYNDNDATRTTDLTQSVAAVGEVIAEELRARGVSVLHDTTLHDSPQYSGAYSRAEDTINAYLAQYPSIRVVLDIHRDAMMYDDLTKVKPTVTVNGQKAAQVMLVVGGTDTAELPNAHCETNLRFGLQVQHALESTYSGLTRPLYVVDARYNQGLVAGSLLIEIGTDANTLSEALYSGRLVGKTLAEVLS